MHGWMVFKFLCSKFLKTVGGIPYAVMNRSAITLGAVLAGVIMAMAGAATDSAAAQSGGIPEVVVVGGIFDVSGNWSLEGEESKAVTEMAINDLNEYLAAIGAGWSMSMQAEDAQANASVALDKIQSLRSRGIDLFLGMSFSSHIQTAKGYIDANNLLVISHASQAANLAIDDAIFRLRPNDNNQAPAVDAMLKDAGIEVLATVNRGDTWGDGLVGGVAELFDGEIIELFRYNPDAVDFSVEASILDEDIGRLVEEHGADKVGVLYIGTNEFILMIQQMSLYDNIDDVRWFSTNTQAGNSVLLDDPQVFEFVRDTQLTAVRSIAETNSLQKYVNDWVVERYGRTASIFTYPAYDAVWLLGMSIQQAQTIDVDTLREVVPMVARTMLGSAGHLELSEAGDLANSSYEIWHVVDAGWAKDADYQDGSVIREGSAQDAAEMIAGTGSVPDWVRTNAGWWADGLIDDETFLRAIQFLISEGVLVVP